MDLRSHLPLVLIVLGVAGLVGPALAPVEPRLYHDARPGTTDGPAELRERGYDVVAYENLSERGKELYVRTLRADGEYAVPLGEGAPDFAYPNRSQLASLEDYRERNALQNVVIERPRDADLPPADEPVEHVDRRPRERRDPEEAREGPGTPTATPSVEERRQRVGRYDVLSTRTERPGFTELPNLLRFLSVGLGAVALATGGYLRSLP